MSELSPFSVNILEKLFFVENKHLKFNLKPKKNHKSKLRSRMNNPNKQKRNKKKLNLKKF